MITSRTVRLLVMVLACAAPSFADQKTDAIEALLARYHELGAFNGTMLVAEGGKVIYKKGFGMADFEWKIPNTPDTRFRLGSITKQFTSAVMLQLVEEGKLTLETTLVDALPYYRKDTGGKVTIHHLLNHTSGIPSYTSRPEFASDISRDPYEVKAFVEKFCSGNLEFEPGGTFRYNNSGYFILGAIIEHVTGQPYDVVLAERVFKPLGMEASGYDRSGAVIGKRARGYERSLAGVRNANYLDMSLPYAAGSLYSTVEDLYLWDQGLYGDRILPAAARARMFTPGLANYGYGWGIEARPVGPDKAARTVVSHGGGINGFNTLIVRIPEDRHLVVLLNNTGGTALTAMSAGVLDILYGRTPSSPRQPVSHLLHETLGTKGIEAALAQYGELKKTHAKEVAFDERFLNELGYELMRVGRLDDAIEILKLNVEAFPAQSNPYDSLGEAYMKARKKDLAIKNYAKSLELNPANSNAVERLQDLEASPAFRAPASPAAAPADDVSSPERIVAALYDVISGPAGKARDWDRFRSLFAPGARLVPAEPRRDGTAPVSLSPDDYVTRTSDAFTKNGFFEREIARRAEAFGTIAHVFSTYESRRASEAEPFARGINSIQLLQHNGRWWIVTVMWDQERPGNPVPAEYLIGR